MKANTGNFSSYEAVIDWLFVQLPNYQSQGTSAYKPGLDNINALLEGLDCPQDNFKSIHIAGTNGKGSTAHMLASVYQEANYKVGVFTSPHISDFRERVKINGQMISEFQVIDFVNQSRAIIDELQATFFEITTALAFHIFSSEQVDVAIIETGLGGRLDSTNVLKPELSIITTIGLDHTQFLGDTIEEIAKEKAGIIKLNRPLVVGNIPASALLLIQQIANQKNAEIHFLADSNFETDLKGGYQKENHGIVIKALEVLQSVFPVSEEAIITGSKKVAVNTNFYGRFQQIKEFPRVILDAAHNKDGVEAVFQQLAKMSFENLFCIYGSSNDKDLDAIFNLFPKSAQFSFVEFNSPRSMTVSQFQQLALSHHLNADYYQKSMDAYKSVTQKAGENDVILIFGSFYIFSEILKSFE